MTLVKNSEYSIKYINGAGNISHRNITVISACDPLYGKGYLKAWCHLRGEERTFRYDRILKAELCKSQTSDVKTLSPIASNHDGGQVIRGSADASAAPAAPAVPSVSASSSCSPGNNFSDNNSSYSLGHFICMAITAAVLGAFGIGPFAGVFNPPEVNSYSIDYSFIKPAPDPVVIPLPAPPAPLPHPSGSLPRIPAVNKTAVTENTDQSVKKRKTLFREISGIINIKLENIYESADTDHSGVISWNEVENFQNKIFRNYAYIANSLALRPDEFLEQGGGDCEDWALFTCGLLTYWDIISYVGSFGAESGTGHAVCLVPVNSPVEKYSYYRLDDFDNFPDAYYIPIDYNHVGSLSGAVDRKWNLRRLYIPSAIYGLYM